MGQSLLLINIMSYLVFLVWCFCLSGTGRAHTTCVHLREKLAQEQQAEVQNGMGNIIPASKKGHSHLYAFHKASCIKNQQAS